MSDVRTFKCDCGRVVVTNNPGREFCLRCEDEIIEAREEARHTCQRCPRTVPKGEPLCTTCERGDF